MQLVCMVEYDANNSHMVPTRSCLSAGVYSQPQTRRPGSPRHGKKSSLARQAQPPSAASMWETLPMTLQHLQQPTSALLLAAVAR